MINKKNVLGKIPEELGVKDAIHTAIVAVRANCAIRPGQRCGMNEHSEAVPDDDGPGVADPYLKKTIRTGQAFWLLLGQSEVPNVRHDWEHEKVSFAAPTREVKHNPTIKERAERFGVTYDQVMDAADYVIGFEPSGKASHLVYAIVGKPGDTRSPEEAKYETMRELGKMTDKARFLAQAIMMSTEAWAVTTPSGELPEGVTAVRHHPDRFEIITVAAQPVHCEFVLGCYIKTTRTEAGFVVPGEVSDMSEDARSDLLTEFWRGYFGRHFNHLNQMRAMEN